MAHISIERLTVEFAIFGAHSRSLKNSLLAQATGGKVMAGAKDIVIVRAIDSLNVEVKDGDRIGLVGHNGSGKTTLLRVLAGIYKPTQGSITIRGRIAAFLDPMAGIDPDSTGFENIYLRGYLVGMSHEEIKRKVDDIAEFSELGDFLALPMRTYSAGMVARLAFAITTAVHQDILLIDEGIGVGDEGFQKRANARIESLFNRTPIVVLASHSDALIAQYCNRRLELQHGVLVANQERQLTANPGTVAAPGQF